MEASLEGRRHGAIYLLRWMWFLLLTGSAIIFSPLQSVQDANAAEPLSPFPLERVFSFGPDGTEATDFNRAASVALDQQRNRIYVLKETASETALFKFAADGQPVDFEGANPDIEGNRINGLESLGTSRPNKLGVDSTTGVVYVVQPGSLVAFQDDGEPAEFTAGPGVGTSAISGLGDVRSVAVDSNGTIYAGVFGGNTISIFASTGEPLTSFAAPDPTNVTVAADGTVYVNESASVLKRFTPSSFPVSAVTTYSESTFASPASGVLIAGISVDPVNGDVYAVETNAGGTAWIRRYDSAGTLVESLGAPTTSTTSTASSAFGAQSGQIAVWGVAREIAERETIKLYLSDTEQSKSPNRSKVAAVGRKILSEAPEITKTLALDVTVDSAKLRAWIDPNNEETTYRFEYGLEDCAVAITPCISVPLGGASAGGDGDPVAVTQPLFDLQPDTTYHYRVLADNLLGPAVGPSQTFATQPLGMGFELIDSRAWEMVSPSDKRGAQLKGPRGGLIQAASDGDGLAYLSLGTIEADPDGNRALEFSAVLAQRVTNGWRSKDIASANEKVIPLGVGVEGEFKFFSSDLSKGILMPRGATLLSPQASERTPYLRQEGDPPLYTPLLSGKEGFANVPPGIKFGGAENDTVGEVAPIGATPDLSQIVLRSELSVSLVPGLSVPGPPFQALYLWSEGQLQPISVLPSGEGGAMAFDPVFGSGRTTVQRAISVDGSRVFWGRAGSALYLRDTIAEETVRLDVAQGGGAGGANPVFQGASADGTVVFFRDTRDLTADASPVGHDLYRCEIPPGGPAGGCADLTNVSAPLEESGESAEVLGMASGLSEDGTRIYFVARGVLDEAPNEHGESAGGDDPNLHPPNLYLWEEGEGVRFIATLDEEDKGTWGLRTAGPLTIEASKLSASISPSGRYLAFMSQRSLSGQVNLDEASGEPAQEVFRYDAEADSLDCISCNPFGAAPEAREPAAESLIDPHNQYTGIQAAATLPAGYRNEFAMALYRPRTALDNGRVFFNAFDSLVPADSNGEWDVYQWEPSGVGGCGAASGDGATVQSAGGCVSLLSSGTGEKQAAFMDADVSGDDVFFLTPARLSVKDTDSELDVYDARVDGVEAKEQPQVECEGETCHPAAPPPEVPTPNSATFVGPGNEKPPKPKRCAKGKRKTKVKGKVRCVPKKQKQKGKASKNRGAGR